MGKVKKKKQRPVVKPAAPAEAGYCVYLGPSVTGVIQTGTVYRGTRAEVLAQLTPITERFPLVPSLVVTGDTLPEDRIKVRTPGNLLYAKYRQMAAGIK